MTDKEKELQAEAIGYYRKQIADLENENAELKERLKEHESIGNAQFWKNVWSWKTKAEQLTKVKFLLKQLVDAFPKSYSDVVKDTLDEARKFVEE